MDYYDDKKRSKFRSDRYDTKSNRYKQDDYDDDYYNDSYSSNKKQKSKHSRSRSRSRSRTRSDSAKFTPKQTKSINSKPAKQTHTPQPSDRSSQLNKYENNPFPVAPTVEPMKKFNPGVPSRTIMLRQVPTTVDDYEIKTELDYLAVPYKEIRLVKNRDTGLSRGFAFVEFNTVQEAQHWMEVTQGWILFSNHDNKIQLFYSNSSADEAYNASRQSALATEWDCNKCGIRNFKRREKCFKCGITREESDKRKGGEGYDFVGSTPCNTLLLRGLDALTTKDTIINALNNLTNFTLPIKSVHIAKDNFTNIAMGFAFVEMSSIQDAGYLLQCYQTNFEIDGKQITVNYSKNSFKTAISQLETYGKMSYEQMSAQDSGPYHHSSGNSNKRINQADAANSAAAVAQAAMLNMHKKQELLTQITTNLNQPTVAVAYPAQDVDSSVANNLKYIANQVETISNQVYSAPDVTQFAYDETSGYYYDYTTGFYYDANTQYFYNAVTQQYMYWDQTQSTYVPVTSTTTTTTAATTTITTTTTTATETSAESTNDSNKTQEKSSELDSSLSKTSKPTKPTPKTAAQIAKDMEKWAELMNKKKESVKKVTTTPVTKQTSSNIEVKQIKPVEMEVKPPPPQQQQQQQQQQIQQLKPDDLLFEQIKKQSPEKLPEQDIKHEKVIESENQSKKIVVDESSLIDTIKLACLLCKRKFDSLEILNKHVQKSDLHKTNLEKLKQEENIVIKSSINEVKKDEQRTSDSDSLQAALKYRDRAMERRKKYGSPEPPSPPYTSSTYCFKISKIVKENDDDSSSSLSNSYSEKSTVASSSSVAAKLMKKMGWNEGSGIGKNLQGISAPIEATVRSKGAGLGSSSTIEIDPNDSYQEAAKKSARARFERLNN